MKTTIGRLAATIAVVIFAGLASVPAFADDNNPGVARISLTNGNVTVQRGDSGDTVAAAVNAPVMVGDYLSTSDNSRGEVQFDNADFVRVGSDTQVRFTQLGSTDNEFQLAAGTVDVRTFQDTDAKPQVDTPSITIRPDEPGSYRVTVTSDGDTIFSVRSGSADLLAPQGAQTVTAGNSVLVKGASNNPQISGIDTVADDSFDSWNSDRDQYEIASANPYADPNANSGIVGTDDLSHYGRWVDSSQYGQVWVPNDVGANWAPYQNGTWSYEPYYGWTWVGYEPWGWAPYHYGRWFYAAPYGWAWDPGPAYVAPVWQPAYVAFVGVNVGGFSLGLSFGNVGWVALAPGEAYHPWYRSGGYYNNNVTNVTNITNITNITNVTNITNIYKNAGKPGGCNVVTATNFQKGGGYHYLPVHGNDLHKVTIAKGTLPIVPTHDNLRFNNKQAAPVAISKRFGKLPMPQQRLASFNEQRQAVQEATRQQTPVRSGAAHVPVTHTNVTAKNSVGVAGTHQAMPAATKQSTALRQAGAAQAARVDIKPTAHVATIPNVSARTTGVAASSPWTRFASARGETSNVANRAPQAPVNEAKPSAHVATLPNVSARAQSAPAAKTIAPNSVWDRFGSSGHVTANAAPANDNTVSRPATAQVHQPVASRPVTATQPSAWDRFGSSRPVASPAVSQAAPARAQTTQSRTTQPTSFARFGTSGATQSAPAAPRYNAAPSSSTPRYSAANASASRNNSAPSYSAPRYNAAPSYSAPRYAPAPRYATAPRSAAAPSYSPARSYSQARPAQTTSRAPAQRNRNPNH